MKTQTDLDRLLKSIAKNPEDWTLRKIAADAAEEVGDQALADCLRWMANNQKRAWAINSEPIQYHWYGVDEFPKNLDPQSDLPTYLFERLSGYFGGSIDHKAYRTAKLSEEAVYMAWRGTP